MVYTELTKNAISIAYSAHHGQVDKSGVPYICHPLHLAESMDDEISCCVALLHDVVEDTEVTLQQLAREFPAAIVEAVALLTHDPDTDYFDYVRRIRSNPIAKKVKLADLAHNCDASRFAGVEVPKERIGYFRDKYTKARAILLEE
jgi:(p)ppGpp synthase/HD superfamily hydrolase